MKTAMGRVLAEIRQETPFDRPEREVAITLLRTGDVLHHALESALRPWGVSPEQYNVLRILRGAGEDGRPTLEIATRMIARSPNITRMIDKMVAAGLARRERLEEDRRQVRISITPAGQQVLSELDRAVDTLLAQLRFLKRASMKSLVEQLDAVRERLGTPTVREVSGRRRSPSNY